MLEQTKYCIEETIKNSTFLLYYHTAKFCIFLQSLFHICVAAPLHMCCSRAAYIFAVSLQHICSATAKYIQQLCEVT